MWAVVVVVVRMEFVRLLQQIVGVHSKVLVAHNIGLPIMFTL